MSNFYISAHAEKRFKQRFNVKNHAEMIRRTKQAVERGESFCLQSTVFLYYNQTVFVFAQQPDHAYLVTLYKPNGVSNLLAELV